MVRSVAASTMLFFGLVAAFPAAAQAQAAPAGGPYVPSTHSPGCGGLLCDPVDPSLAVVPAPPCAGLICGASPITAAEAARIQEERARAAAAAAVAEPVKPARHARRHVVTARAGKGRKTVAARTPDPASPQAPAAR